MAIPKFKVTYADGREVEILGTPRAQLTAEEALGGFVEGNVVKATHYIAWAALHKAGREPAGFDEWVDLIADLEEMVATDAEDATADPTTSAPSSTDSSG